MRVKLRTLLLGAAVVTVAGWGARRNAVAVVAQPVAPVAERAPEEGVERAATATLALALLAGAPCAGCESGLFDSFGLEVAQIARGYLLRRPRGFRDDCSGFVSAVFTQAGVPMDHIVATLWDRAEANDALHWSAPHIGDLVFFDDTWDRDHDGQWDDPLTHVGLVVDVEPDQTVVFAHAGTSAGRSVGYMNLDEPFLDRDAAGRRINTWLREPEAFDPPDAGYLASDLWAGFATVDPEQDWLTGSPLP